MSGKRRLAVASLGLMGTGVALTLLGLMVLQSEPVWGTGLGLFLAGLGISGVLADESLEGEVKDLVCCEAYRSFVSLALSGLAIHEPVITSVPMEGPRALLVYSSSQLSDVSEVEPGIGVVAGIPYIAFVCPLPPPSGDPAASVRMYMEEFYGPVEEVSLAEERETIRIMIRGIFRKRPSRYDPGIAGLVGYLANYIGSPLSLVSVGHENGSLELVLKIVK